VPAGFSRSRVQAVQDQPLLAMVQATAPSDRAGAGQMEERR
jgi:hypothetical protein